MAKGSITRPHPASKSNFLARKLLTGTRPSARGVIAVSTVVAVLTNGFGQNVVSAHKLVAVDQTCIAATTNDQECVFPFVYKDKTYDTCTTAGGGSKHWCATKVNADNTMYQQSWGHCKQNRECRQSDKCENNMAGGFTCISRKKFVLRKGWQPNDAKAEEQIYHEFPVDCSCFKRSVSVPNSCENNVAGEHKSKYYTCLSRAKWLEAEGKQPNIVKAEAQVYTEYPTECNCFKRSMSGFLCYTNKGTGKRWRDCVIRAEGSGAGLFGCKQIASFETAKAECTADSDCLGVTKRAGNKWYLGKGPVVVSTNTRIFTKEPCAQTAAKTPPTTATTAKTTTTPVCVPYSEAACRAAAIQAGHTLGKKVGPIFVPFSSTFSFYKPGCVTYSTGVDYNITYYGNWGSNDDKAKKDLTENALRVPGADCEGVPCYTNKGVGKRWNDCVTPVANGEAPAPSSPGCKQIASFDTAKKLCSVNSDCLGVTKRAGNNWYLGKGPLVESRSTRIYTKESCAILN